MLRLLAGLVALSAVAMMPLSAASAIGELDPAFVRSEAPCAQRFSPLPSDRGGSFVFCATTTSAQGSSGVEFQVSKFDSQGRPDISWGENGVAKTFAKDTVAQLFIFNYLSPLNLRDGGIALFVRDGMAFRFSRHGTLVPGFGAKRDLSLVPLDPPNGWGLFGIEQGADGDFAALGYSAVNLSQRTQSLAVRRFDADGQFIEEFRYRVDLNAFNSASGLTVDSLLGQLFSWELDGNKLAILRPTAGFERLVGLTLTPDGAQAARVAPLMVRAVSPHFRDPSLYVLPDGKLIGLAANERFGEARVLRWNADGSRDLSFGAKGGTDSIPLFSGCPASLSLHARGEFSVKGASLGFTGATSFGGQPLLGCGAGFQIALTSEGRDVVGQWAVRPDANVSYYGFLIDRSGGVIYREVFTFDGIGRIVDHERPLLTRVVGYAPRADVKVVEYYNPDLDHYFITAHEHEIDFVDKGNAGATWRRTGNSFGAWNVDTPMPGTNTVCRFYGDVAAGPNSHFFSAHAFECDLLRAMELATPVGRPAWRYERDAFRITIPVDSACPANLTPVTRFYNGKQGAVDGPNHRYVTRQVDIDAMTKRGWFNEGVRMCAVLE